MNEKQPLAPDRIMQFAWGYAPTLAIEAAVQHEIFDILEKGPRTVEQLAEETGASVRGLTAILNLLVGLQLLGRDGPRYLLTPESAAFLVSSQPRYHGMFFKHISDQLLPNWLQLSQIVRTGQPATKANDQNEGAEFFAKFVESLFPISFAAANALGAGRASRNSEGHQTAQRARYRRWIRSMGHRIGKAIAARAGPCCGLAAGAGRYRKGRPPARGDRPSHDCAWRFL